jgi:ethylbenzene dioxygenase subunit beta
VADERTREALERVRAFVDHEVGLIDDGRLYDWLELFAEPCLYWVPIGDDDQPGAQAALVRDDALALEERVHHLMETPFPSQSPRSRTLHLVTNVAVEPAATDPDLVVTTHQLISEVRDGDFTQTGLGEVRHIPARVEYQLRQHDGSLRITRKTVRLLASNLPQDNLTFLL